MLENKQILQSIKNPAMESLGGAVLLEKNRVCNI
jgi:hypothetical protein